MSIFSSRDPAASDVDRLVSVLVDEPADSVEEVARRSRAADDLAALGASAMSALPALLRTLIVEVRVDCVLALRVAAAVAVWKVSHRSDVALPFLTWALRDEYWGVAPQAVATLSEIGDPRVLPDLIRLAERRLTHGPYWYESFRDRPIEPGSDPLLASVAEALGQCARGQFQEQVDGGQADQRAAHALLVKLTAQVDGPVRVAATQALQEMGTPDGLLTGEALPD